MSIRVTMTATGEEVRDVLALDVARDEAAPSRSGGCQSLPDNRTFSANCCDMRLVLIRNKAASSLIITKIFKSIERAIRRLSVSNANECIPKQFSGSATASSVRFFGGLVARGFSNATLAFFVPKLEFGSSNWEEVVS